MKCQTSRVRCNDCFVFKYSTLFVAFIFIEIRRLRRIQNQLRKVVSATRFTAIDIFESVGSDEMVQFQENVENGVQYSEEISHPTSLLGLFSFDSNEEIFFFHVQEENGRA